MSECAFCTPDAFKGRVITEYRNFRIVAALGQAPKTGGHIIIVPREHFPCMTALPGSSAEHLTEIEDQARKAITMAYGIRPLFFEHGIAGQTVSHAHMHALPSSYNPTMDILSYPYDRLPAASYAMASRHWEALREGLGLRYGTDESLDKSPYLYWQPQSLTRFMLPAASAPERFFLSLLAQNRPLEFHQIDWRNRSPEEAIQDDKLIADTLSRLSSAWMKVVPPKSFQ